MFETFLCEILSDAALRCLLLNTNSARLNRGVSCSACSQVTSSLPSVMSGSSPPWANAVLLGAALATTKEGVFNLTGGASSNATVTVNGSFCLMACHKPARYANCPPSFFSSRSACSIILDSNPMADTNSINLLLQLAVSTRVAYCSHSISQAV